VTSADDFFVKHHGELLDADAILVGAYCPENRSTIKSVYQQFIERTRYLRRDNYVFEDLLVAPFVVSHIEARQSLHIRMAGSMIRHHTVMHRPIIAFESEGQLLNTAAVARDSDLFLARSRELLVGRYLQGREETEYRPVGYQISAAKALEEQASGKMAKTIGRRLADHGAKADRRLALKKTGSN
jgi:hypothetical protein